MPNNENRSFDPSTEDANRTRQQGGGMGERELEAQRDPTRSTESERELSEANEALTADNEGPIEGLQQGRTNTNREFEDETDDVQGARTTEANRDKVRGSPDMNP